MKRKRRKKLIEILQKQRGSKLSTLIGSQVEVMVEGSSDESEMLLQARMPTQAQEIDGRVLINDLGSDDAPALSPGDLVLVEITELAETDLVAKLIRVTKPMMVTSPGLTTQLQKGTEMRNGRVAH